MKLNNFLFEDFSRVASGAASALSGLREQVHAQRPFAAASDSISREEFDAVAAMAAKARETHEALLRRIEALEAVLKNNNTDETVTSGGDDI